MSNNFVEVVVFFYFNVGSGAQTHLVRLAQKSFYPLRQLTCPAPFS